MTQELLYGPPIARQPIPPSHGRIRRYLSPGRSGSDPAAGEPGSPEFLSAYLERQGFCRWRRCGDGGPHGGGAPHFAMVDRIAAGLTEPRCASERRLARGGGRPAERRFTVGDSGKSVARCHRTVLAYWKFESISLQQTVRLCPDFAFIPGKSPGFPPFWDYPG